MKLSMSLLGKYLNRFEPEYHITRDSLRIKGIRFLNDPQKTSSPEYVYLGAASGYYQDIRYIDGLLLVNGNNQLICHGTDREELLNEILSAFEHYNTLEMKLLTLSNEHAGLSVMLKTMKEMFSGAILIFDMDGNLLSSVNLEKLGDQALAHDLHQTGHMSTDVLGATMLDEEGNVSHDLTDYPQHLYMIEDYEKGKGNTTVAQSSWGAVSMYLFQQEERIGFIMLFPTSKEEIAAAMQLEPLYAQCTCQAEEFTSRTSPLLPNRQVMLSLLRGEQVGPAAYERFERNMNFTDDAYLIVLENLAIQNYTLRSLIMKELSSMDKTLVNRTRSGQAGQAGQTWQTGQAGQTSYTTFACEFEDMLVILTESTYIRRVLEYLQEKLPVKNLALGVSMRFHQFDHMPVVFRQALFALRSTAGPGIRYCRDLAPAYLIQSLREQEMSMELIHPAIGILQDYDQQNNTDLLATLRAYVGHSCNQKETAAVMHIHLNTLKYRLKRISELGTVDLKNEDEIFYIALSLRLAGLS